MVEEENKGEDERLEEFFGNRLNQNPSEDVLKELQEFVHSHNKQLKELREKLTDNPTDIWNIKDDAVALTLEPYENVPNPTFFVQDRTANEILNKIVNVFACLCYEIDSLKEHAEENVFIPLSLFTLAEEQRDDEKGDEEDINAEMKMARMIPFLQDVSNFVTRVHFVVRNLVEQLAHIYHHPKQMYHHQQSKLYISTFKYVQFNYVFQKLSEALSILVTLDVIVRDNEDLTEAWDTYKKMLGYVKCAPDKWEVDRVNLKDFQHQIIGLESSLLSGNTFTNCIAQPFGAGSSVLAAKASEKDATPVISKFISGSRALHQEMDRYIRSCLKRQLNELKNTEIRPRATLVDLMAIFALERRIFHHSTNFDKKLFKQIWTIQADVPLVYLPGCGQAVWYLADFLIEHVKYPGKSIDMSKRTLIASRKALLAKKDQEFTNMVNVYYVQMSAWMIKFDEENDFNVEATSEISAHLRVKNQHLISGIILANKIRNTLTESVFLHLQMEVRFKKQNIRSMAVCAELLKSIELAYHRQSKRIAEQMSYLLVLIQRNIQEIVLPLKRRLEKEPRVSAMEIDALAALRLCMLLLNGAPTKSRRSVLNVGAAVASMKNLMKVPEIEEIRYHLWKLDILCSWQTTLRRTCDVSFLYWTSELHPVILQDIQDSPEESYRLPYWSTVVADAVPMLRKCKHEEDNERLLKEYEKIMNEYLEEEIVTPLCHSTENDLRLHMHSVVLDQAQLQTENKNLNRFVKLPPFRFLGKLVDLKRRIEHYLDLTFYNMSTIALHDWKIYSKMRNLALKKYGLVLTEVHLPSHSHYSEGLDVLMIMRNIHVFVTKYNYNLNTQIFVEKATDQLHLNTINIKHIANSIRTHGTGIMNTTVNFTYQYLTVKWGVFSEFLFDDHIKSRLMKDLRFFKEHRNDLNNMYPYERAHKFNRGIRSLGLDEDGLTYLDHFRGLVTEIGNALGYVRMIRSGGLQYVSEATQYLPDIYQIPKFTPNVENLSEGSKKAAKNVDHVLEDLSSSSAENSNYYRPLVDAFQSVLRVKQNEHLDNFVGIIPPMMLNFVEKMLIQKDRVTKKGSVHEQAFTDDGFALGVAFFLEILDQNKKFNSFHWFEEVQGNIKTQEEELRKEKGSKPSRSEEDDAQTWTLSMKRLRNLKQEWSLLDFSFQAARIFFRSEQTEEKAGEEKKNEEEEEVKEEEKKTDVVPKTDLPTEEQPGEPPVAPPKPPQALQAPPVAPSAPPVGPPVPPPPQGLRPPPPSEYIKPIAAITQ